jgi:hypothetical protein
VFPLSLLLAVATVLSDTGDIYIHTDPGIVIYLDGVRAGVSSIDESGLWLHTVKIGVHEVRFEMGSSTSATRVKVVKAETTTVNVSSLALRSGATRNGGIEIKLLSQEKDCAVTLGETEKPIVDSVAGFYDLLPGSYDVAVSCGGSRTIQGKATVTSGRTTDMEANLKTRLMRAKGDHPRVAQPLKVRTSQDKIANAPLPAEAKRALMAAFVPGMQVIEIRSVGPSLIVGEFESASVNDAALFVERLQGSEAFQSIQIGFVEARPGSHAHFQVAMEPRW